MKIDAANNTQSWVNLTWHKNTKKASVIEYHLPQKKLSWQSAYEQTVTSIIKHYPAPYYLCVTGGVDSQAMLYAWYNTVGAHPDVIPISFLYNNQCNEYDQVGISEICTKYGYHRQIKSFDLMAFIDSGECKEYQISYYTQSPQMAAWIKMIESLVSGTVIMSGELTDNKKPTSMIANHFGVMEYARNLNLSGSELCYIPFFFEHDIDIATAHWPIIEKIKYNVPEPDDHDVLQNRKNTYLNIKVPKYQSVGYPVIPQYLGPIGRCSGFEKFKDLYEETHVYDRNAAMRAISNPAERSERMFDVNLRSNLLDTIKYKHFFTCNALPSSPDVM